MVALARELYSLVSYGGVHNTYACVLISRTTNTVQQNISHVGQTSF